jgi:hypothetical protein
MSLSALLALLDERDVRLSLRLVVSAPVGAITPDIREGLIRHKTVLLERLIKDGGDKDTKVQGKGSPSDPSDSPRLISSNWRATVAAWSRDCRANRRALVSKILHSLPPDDRRDPAKIAAAEYAAYLEAASPDEYRAELLRFPEGTAESRAACWRRAEALKAGGMDERLAEHFAVAERFEGGCLDGGTSP